MNVNFSGVHSPRVFITRNPYIPNLADSVTLRCNISDDEEGCDLSELKRVAASSEALAPHFKDFDKYDVLDIRTFNTDEGTKISLNKCEVDYSDYSIFGILTFIATVTRKAIPKFSENTNSAAYVKAVNSFICKLGEGCLEKVFR